MVNAMIVEDVASENMELGSIEETDIVVGVRWSLEGRDAAKMK